MALAAFCAPILPGKLEQWRHFMQELRGSRYNEFKTSRDRYGVHERAFLQTTPDGDMAIVTLEGNAPEAFFQKWATSQDSFTRWFVQQVKEIHGFDLSQGLPGTMPELAVDSENQNLQRRAA